VDALTDIRRVSPIDPEVAPLVAKHVSLMRASSPACSVHAMDADALADADAQFFAAFKNKQVVAIGAIKRLTPTHGEIKSMHVRSDCRGSGLADAILKELLACGQRLGIQHISLETGSQDVFQPARSFYRRHGFSECPPFGDYELDTNSVFMTRSI
jgi:putative acetyltransferase